MKYTFTKGLFVAAIATLFAACSTDDAADQAPVAPGKIEVSLNAALPESRAQINVDETNGRFTGAWEATDIMTVLAKGSASGDEAAQFTYDASSKVFKGQLTDAKQDWTYQAVYPYVAAAGAEHKIPFGAARTQKGNNFNGAYDPLVSAPVTHQASEPGKTPQGEAVTFGLNRLTAILAVTFTTDDASVKSEKVKTVVLTAADGKMIAAKTFDIDKSALSGALGADEQSDAITLSYEEGSEPTAESFKAYFNVPAANYGKLTAAITTEGHTATLDLSDGVELTAGELAYGTKAVTGWTASGPAAPTLEWVDNPDFEKQEIKDGMSILVNIEVEAGIDVFQISINSKTLKDYLLLFGFTEVPGVENTMITDLAADTANENLIQMLGLTPPLKNQTSLALNLSTLVPLIATLPNNEGEHQFTLNLTDVQGRTLERTLIFYIPSPALTYNGDANLWTNTATLTATNVPADATNVKIQYKKTSDSAWQDAIVTKNEDGSYTGKIVSAYNADHTMVSATGIRAKSAYNCQLLIDNQEKATTSIGKISDGDAIPSSGFETWGTAIAGGTAKDRNPNDPAETTYSNFWSTGNNSMAKDLCQKNTDVRADSESTACAYMAASAPMSIFAAGNLFTGSFSYASPVFAWGGGTVKFGSSYNWTARPTALKVWVKTTVGDIDTTSSLCEESGVSSSRISVCVFDSDTPIEVQSKVKTVITSTEFDLVGGFDPTDTDGTGILAYGDHPFTSSIANWTEITIPIVYVSQDETPKPSKTYNVIISCATDKYGDKFCGCSKNKLWVDDFEWVY